MASFEKPPESGNMPARASVPIHMQTAVRGSYCAGRPSADVLLVGERVDDDAGAHEQQRLEEGVRDQVEDAVQYAPRPTPTNM